MSFFERLKLQLPTLPAGSSFSDVMNAIQAALLKAIPLAEAIVGPGQGSVKKEVVLTAIEKFYDTTIAPLDIPYLPNLVVEPWVDAKLRTLIRPVFGPVVDSIVTAFNNELPVPKPAPAVPVTPPAPLPPLDPDHEGVG